MWHGSLCFTENINTLRIELDLTPTGMHEGCISSLSNRATVFCIPFPLPVQGRFCIFSQHHHTNSIVKHTQTQKEESPHLLPQRLHLSPHFQLLFIQNRPQEALVVAASLSSLLIPFSDRTSIAPSALARPRQSQHNLTLPNPVAAASLSAFLAANDPGFWNSWPLPLWTTLFAQPLWHWSPLVPSQSSWHLSRPLLFATVVCLWSFPFYSLENNIMEV